MHGPAPSISGLDVREEIGRGGHCVIYRAEKGTQSVAVKVPIARPDDGETGASLQAFRREAAVLARVRHVGLPEILDVGTSQDGTPYLAMELVDGKDLASEIANGALPDSRVRAIGQALASVLAEIHRHGLVHRDIKPSNVLFDAAGHLKVIDFGLATTMRVGAQTADVVGTIRYASPEQIGSLKRPVDGRSDLYSLGAVLFECATGAPPFSGTAAELIHQHATVAPPGIELERPERSRALAAIILRLLAKDPDDRYQTASSLAADLSALDELDEVLSTGAQPILGRLDFALTDRIPLVGREAELKLLLDRLHDTMRSERPGSAVLLRGPPGSGKTRLVRELLIHAEERVALVLHGECTEGDPLPFAVLRRALDQYLQRISRLADEARERAEKVVRDAVGESAGLVRTFSSRMAALLADVPGDVEVDVQGGYQSALSEVLVRLAAAHPCALIVIDDTQWIDDASLGVIDRLSARLDEMRTLLLCTERDQPSEVSDFEREVSSRADVRFVRLPIQPLETGAVERLVVSHLGGRPVDPRFVEQIAVRAQHNPLAVGEYVRAALEAGLLKPFWGTWLVNATGLDSLELPTDVLELITRRLDGLTAPARKALRAGAVQGSTFDLTALADAGDLSEADVVAGVSEAVEAQVLQRSAPSRYSFMHDRLREALLASLSEASLRDLHQRTAVALDRDGRDGFEHVVAIARHYARGDLASTPLRAFETNFAAGLASLERYAFEEAYGFLGVAQGLAARLGKDGGALSEALGEASWRTGRLQQAVKHFDAALRSTKDKRRRALLYERLIRVHAADIDFDRAWQEVRHGFENFGWTSPRTGALGVLAVVWNWLAVLLLRSTGWGFGKAAPDERDVLVHQARLLETGTAIAVAQGHGLHFVLLTLWQMRISHRLGPTRALPAAYLSYALLLSHLRMAKAARWYAAEAARVADSLGDPLVRARSNMLQAQIVHLAGFSRDAEVLARRAIARHSVWLDHEVMMYGYFDFAWNLQVRGYAREVAALTTSLRKQMRMTRSRLDERKDQPYLYALSAAALAILGQRKSAATFLDGAMQWFDGTKTEESVIWADLLAGSLLVHLQRDDAAAHVDAACERAHRLGIRPTSGPYHRFFFVPKAYARLEQWRCATGDAAAAERLREAAKELRAAAHVPALQCHSSVIDAAVAAMDGDLATAHARLVDAESRAREADSPWAMYEAAFLRAHLLERANNTHAAEHEARRAHCLAVDHAWTTRVRRVQERFPGAADGATSRFAAGGAEPSDSSGNPTGFRTQRMLDALLHLSRRSAEVHDPERLSKVVLDDLIRLLSAERAFLFLLSTDSLDDFTLATGRDANERELDSPTHVSSTVLERVRLDKRAVIVAGTEDGVLLGSESVVEQQLRSIIAAPLMTRDKLLGVVYLDNRWARGIFTQDDVAILQALTHHIAVALDGARTAQLELQIARELEERRLAESLRVTSERLHEKLDVHDVLAHLLAGIADAIPSARAIVLLRDDAPKAAPIAHGFSDEGESRRVACELGATHAVRDALDDLEPRVIELADAGRAAVESWLLVPVGVDPSVGVIALARKGRASFRDRDRDIASTFVASANIALENARLLLELTRMATIDGLTGVFIRRHFMERGEQEVRRVKRYGGTMSVLMLDVDHFKSVNDEHGHAVGDQVLKEVARRCGTSIRDVDVLGRYGGEEFAVVLPSCDTVAAEATVAERIRSAVHETPVQTDAGRLTVSVSIGVAELDGDPGLQALLARADAALYRAKREGRNRVATAESGVLMRKN